MADQPAINQTTLKADSTEEEFDPVWYLRAYPDIRAAGVDPRDHYFGSGKQEGRYGTSVKGIELDFLLWSGYEDFALPALEKLLVSDIVVESAAASWVLARWAAYNDDWERVRELMHEFLANAEGRRIIRHPGPALLSVQAFLMAGELDRPRGIVKNLVRSFGHKPDFEIGNFLVGKASGATRDELGKSLSQMYIMCGLPGIRFADDDADNLFDQLAPQTSMQCEIPVEQQPLVTVIVPVFNGEAVLGKALSSLVEQSWQNMEVLIVDDGSTDATLDVANEWAQRDERIRVLALGKNHGAYIARNEGFSEAKGAFVTIHDADDWSHPSKIECQARALLENSHAMASVSHWLRVTNNMDMARWRIEDGWVYRNVSSLMVRAEVRDTLGYWDRVKVNADTEYYERLAATYGGHSIIEVLPGLPLAYGRTESSSLTRQSATHVRTELYGTRADYMHSARNWQREAIANEALFLPKYPVRRPFSEPDALSVGDKPAIPSLLDEVAASEFFDEHWYRISNLDVLFYSEGALNNYVSSGIPEDLDPGPRFSASAYRYINDLGPDEIPILHWEQHKKDQDSQPVFQIDGALRNAGDPAKRVLVFAHNSGPKLFGAERSFLDMLRLLCDQGQTPIVVLPSVRNREYLKDIRALSHSIEVIPMPWRHGLRTQHPDTISAIRNVIRRYEIKEVLVNTLVLDAPLLAAKEEGCHSTVFVRELPALDVTLCQNLSMSEDEIRAEIVEQADSFIVASDLVGQWLDCPERTSLRPNAVQDELFSLPFEPGEKLNVALISSNIIKKGVIDFLDVAKQMEARSSDFRFLLIGPPSSDLHDLRPFPANVEFRDYAETPEAAMKQADIVLSLSKFAESFGRTVSEAMAAGRPVICYDRGAPPHLVRQAECGVVVPSDDITAVVEALERYAEHPEEMQKFSAQGRISAQNLQKLSKG